MQQYLAAQDIHERVSSSHELTAQLSEAFARSDALYRCQRVLSVLGESRSRSRRAARALAAAPRGPVTRARSLTCRPPSATSKPGCPPRRPRVLQALHALGDNLTGLARVFGQVMQGSGARPAGAGGASAADAARGCFAPAAQFTLRSALLRHALRLSLMLLLAFGVMRPRTIRMATGSC